MTTKKELKLFVQKQFDCMVTENTDYGKGAADAYAVVLAKLEE